MPEQPQTSTDLEEGEIGGEVHVHEDQLGDGQKILAPSSGGRAPYFSAPGNQGDVPKTGNKKVKKSKLRPEINLRWQPGSAPIRLSDVQDLVLSVLTPQQANPRWCSIKNADRVKKVILIAAHGLVESTLEQHPALATRLSSLFGNAISLQARSPVLVPAQTAHALLMMPPKRKRSRPSENGDEPQRTVNGGTIEGNKDSSTTPIAPPAAKRMKIAAQEDVAGHHTAAFLPQKKVVAATPEDGEISNDDEAGNTSKNKNSFEPPPAKAYVLSLEELEQHEYPLPQLNGDGQLVCPEGFVATKPCPEGEQPKHKIVAVDCEMCVTGTGFELTRATLIDEKGEVLLDELVLPHNPITDYNTQYSGITAAMLEGVTTRLEDIQKQILDIVSAETLLVAHSGENDMRALKIIHANMLDTSVMYPHPRGPPAKSALRVLASRFLRRIIQKGEHDPIEDARAALDLAVLKISKGPTFGTGIVERGEKLTLALSEANKRSSIIDAALSLPRFVAGNTNAIGTAGDDDSTDKAAKEVAKDGVDFVWMQLHSLDDFYKKQANALEAGAGEKESVQSSDMGPVLDKIAEQLAKIYAAASANSLFVIVTGQGNTPYQRYLDNVRYKRQHAKDGEDKWSVEDESRWQQAATEAISALCYLHIKQE